MYERTCLSRMLGGWAAPLPVLNGFMKLTKQQQGLAHRSKLYGDLYWPEQNVLLEYDGEFSHTGRDKLMRDAQRDNAIAARKTKRLTVTVDLYNSQVLFDQVMKELFKLLGVSVHAPSDKQLQVRRQLSRELRMQEAMTWH